MTRCEDYPCCGHTDGLGCNWTYTPAAQAYDERHAMCEHEAGYCDADYYDDDYDPTPTHQWEVTEPREVYWNGEDAWLDADDVWRD